MLAPCLWYTVPKAGYCVGCAR
ncbi:(2Fe-2S)-binding protein [Burkholderia ubonensis]